MTLPFAVTALAQTASALGTGPAVNGEPGSSRAVSSLLPQVEFAFALGVLIALALSCLVVLALTLHVNRWGNVLLQRLRGRAVNRPAVQPVPAPTRRDALSLAPVVSQPVPVPMPTAEFLRMLDSGPADESTADQGWHTLFEDVPGVGRIEWDPQTLRTFACQPDVLYRLAFHRWRLQQGMLSEFEVASRLETSEPADECGGTLRHAGQPSWQAAPNSHGRHAPSPEQQAREAEN